MTNTNSVRGWKATRNMQCRDMEYKAGETYKLPEGESLELCKAGFHSCQRQQDVLEYYNFRNDFVLVGRVITFADKSATDELRVIRVVPQEEWEFMKGNVVRYEDTDGWRTWEYDEQGNVVRHEDSDGEWWTREYDSEGKVISFKSGVIRND